MEADKRFLQEPEPSFWNLYFRNPKGIKVPKTSNPCVWLARVEAEAEDKNLSKEPRGSQSSGSSEARLPREPQCPPSGPKVGHCALVTAGHSLPWRHPPLPLPHPWAARAVPALPGWTGRPAAGGITRLRFRRTMSHQAATQSSSSVSIPHRVPKRHQKCCRREPASAPRPPPRRPARPPAPREAAAQGGDRGTCWPGRRERDAA